MTLKYLFTCHFSDGTTIRQSAEDVSQLDPTKSAFYDVSHRLKDVVKFVLSDGQHTCAVDLTDGHFEIDGFSFYAHEELSDAEYRLIYFRRHQHNRAMGRVDAHSVEYFIGWQTTIDGKNCQETISLR
jgi:hypothetical protein